MPLQNAKMCGVVPPKILATLSFQRGAVELPATIVQRIQLCGERHVTVSTKGFTKAQ
jgi:hypothetical protein